MSRIDSGSASNSGIETSPASSSPSIRGSSWSIPPKTMNDDEEEEDEEEDDEDNEEERERKPKEDVHYRHFSLLCFFVDNRLAA
jgi:TATA-binding protein-associated factor Taf7